MGLGVRAGDVYQAKHDGFILRILGVDKPSGRVTLSFVDRPDYIKHTLTTKEWNHFDRISKLVKICRSCCRPMQDHVNKKCLFEATTWNP